MLEIPTWSLALLIFFLRILDTSISTVRMLYMVQRNVPMAVCLAFCEATIWLFVTANLIYRIKEHWYLIFAFAGGFACGNGIGILIKNRYERAR